jgi:hypothetical protein
VIVRVLHRFRDGTHIFRRLPRREWLLAHERREISSSDEFHRKPRQTVRLADIVNRDDARMLQTRGGGGLGAKTFARGGAREFSGGEHFHRDDAPEPLLPRAVHHAHAAASDFIEQLVI